MGSEFEDNDLPFTDVNLVLEEYEFLIEHVHNKIKEDYKDDETCRFYSRLLGKLLILANQWQQIHQTSSNSVHSTPTKIAPRNYHPDLVFMVIC